MNNDKELIPQEELFPLVNEWIRSVLSRLGGYCHDSSAAGGFCWTLINDDRTRYRTGCVRLCYDHWDVYSDIYKEENVNIRIFTDSIEFNENSKFIDFTRDEMYSLYEFLKDKIFGNKEQSSQDTIENPTNVNIFKHIKSVMKRYPEDSPEYKALYELYHTIKISFNSSYGMFPKEPDYDAMIKYANDQINDIIKEKETSDNTKEDK